MPVAKSQGGGPTPKAPGQSHGTYEDRPQPIVPVEQPEAVAPGRGMVQSPYTPPPVDTGSRFTGIPQGFWQRQPGITGWLVGNSSISDDDVREIGAGVGRVQAWVDNEYRFAGVPGALSGMQAKALDISDPLIRKQALDLIQGLQRLNPEQQTALMAYLRGQVAPVEEGFIGRSAVADPNANVGGEAAVELIAGAGGQASFDNGQLVLAGETGSISLLVALRTLFPEFDATIGADLDQWQGLDDFSADLTHNTTHFADNMADYAYSKSQGVRDMTDLLGELQSGERSAVSTFLPLVGNLASIVGEVGFGAAGGIGRTLGAEGIVEDIAGGADAAQNWLGQHVFEPIIMAGLDMRDADGREPRDAGYLGPADPDVEEQIKQRGGAFALILMGVAGVGGQLGKRIKVARSVPDVALDASALAARNLPEGTTAAQAALVGSRSTVREGALGTAAEIFKRPIREGVRAMDQVAIRFARDPEKWWQQGFRGHNGTRLVSRMMEAKKQHPGSFKGQLGFIQEAYGTSWMTPDLARRVLAETTEDGMRRAFVSHLTEGHVPRGKLWKDRNLKQAEIVALADKAKSDAVIDLNVNDFNPDTAIDGQLINVPAKDLVPHLDFPERANVLPDGTMQGRTAEWVAKLKKSLDEEGYNPETVREGSLPDEATGKGIPEGYKDVEYDPRTGEIFVHEAHHRIGLLAASGKDIKVRIRVKKEYGSVGRVVTAAEKASISEVGRAFIHRLMQRHRTDFVDINEGVIKQAFDRIKAKKWSGMSIDARNGKILPEMEGYTGGILPNDQTITMPIAAAMDPKRFKIAFNDAQTKFRELLERDDVVLGIFRDEELNIVRFEPSVLVPDAATAEAVATHLDSSAGGFYHMTGDEKNIMPVTIKRTDAKPIPESVSGQINTLVKDSASKHLEGGYARGEADRLRLELDAIDQRLAHQARTPIMSYPKRGTLRAGLRAPTSRVEHLVHFIGSNKVFDLAKMVDELPKYPDLFVPGTSNNPADWRARNIDTLSRYMRAARVDGKTVQLRVGELGTVKNQSEFYQLVEREIFGEGGDIDKAMMRYKVAVDPKVRERLINLHDSPIESRSRRYIHSDTDIPGGTARLRRYPLGKQVLNGEETPLPNAPSEYIQRLTLPDVEVLAEANNLVNRLARRAKQGDVVNKTAVALVYELPKFVMNTATMVLKPSVMLFRLPAMMLRIQMEQALRAREFGYRLGGVPKGLVLFPGGIPVPIAQARFLGAAFGIHVPDMPNPRIGRRLFGDDGWNLLAPDPVRSKLLAPTASETGMMMQEMFEGGKVEYVPRKTIEFRTGRHKPKGEDYAAWADDIGQLHEDWLYRGIVLRNLDKDAVLKWLEEDPHAARWMEEQHNFTLEEAGVTREVWIERTIESIKQQVGDNPVLLEAIRTGRARELTPVEIGADFLPDGRNVSEVYNDLLDEVDLLSGEIRTRFDRPGRDAALDPTGKTPALTKEVNDAEVMVMQKMRIKKLQQVAEMRAEHADALLAGSKGVDMADRPALAKYLQRRWEENHWEMPETITVKNHMVQGNHEVGILDTQRRFAQSVSNAMYRPFKAMSYIDQRGTRGSLFGQVYARRKLELDLRGYSDIEATGLARAYAGEMTKDIMYDLSARTSAQRAFKNMAWFAPAWQEVMYTWGVKIPSQSYWPVGAVSLVARYVVAKRAFEEVGVIQKDANGEDVITIPGLSAAIEKITGTKVPEIAFGKLGGLNLVTSSGGMPGLSTPANFALGKAAVKFGGVFKDISAVMQPYGPEAAMLPQPITYAWEALLGEAPPWEALAPELQKRRWDQAVDAGTQYAYADLKMQGIVPPLPEDYGTLQPDGTWSMGDTPAEELKNQKAYTTASDIYLERLRALGMDYARGIAFVKLIGSTVSPMALYASSKEKDEWTKFFSEVIAPQGFGDEGMSERQKNQIDDWLGKHPNSTSFSVFYSEYGSRPRNSGFNPQTDDAFYDAYYTGDKKTMSQHDYSLKLMALESLRHYQSVTDAALDDISPGRDPWELLTNGFQRSGAIQANKESWDRYLFLNPEADAVLTRTRATWAAANDVPVLSYEAERLGNVIDYMKQISGMLTGEETYRSGEVKFVMSALTEAHSEYSKEFGAPNTPTEKAMEWWFTNVMQPYIDHTDVLYQQAQDAEAQGLSPSPYYNQIRAFANAQSPTYKGAPVPNVESVFFGNRSEKEQIGTVLKWQTRPMSWLSNFQLEKAWSGTTQPVKDYLSDVAAFDESFWDQIAKGGISPSSAYYDQLQTWRTTTLTAAAEEVGPEAVAAFQLSEAAPYARLNEADFGAGNQSWMTVTNLAGQVSQRLIGNELSPKGFSTEPGGALELKLWLYNTIETARQNDKGFDELWTQLSDIMPLPNGTPRQNALLYEAVLFGNFRDEIPYAIASIGGTS